jgi:hypothetical protein
MAEIAKPIELRWFYPLRTLPVVYSNKLRSPIIAGSAADGAARNDRGREAGKMEWREVAELERQQVDRDMKQILATGIQAEQSIRTVRTSITL